MAEDKLEKILEKWKNFVEERDWKKFHSPKNIAMGISIEASELLEIFQWLSTEESLEVMNSKEKSAKIKEEMADVFLNLLYLSDILGVDLLEEAQKKMEINQKKYPANACRGQAIKHTEIVRDE